MRGSMIRQIVGARFIGLSVLILTLFFARSAPAQPGLPGTPIAPAAPNNPGQGYTVTPNTGAIALMPELKTAPAPAWVKPGIRILIDKIDGTVSNDPQRRGAGHGYDQIDVLAVLPDAVVADYSNHLVPVDGKATLTGLSGLVTTPGNVMDAWITPAVLQKYATLNGNGVTSTNLDYPVAGRNYHAVSQTVTGQNSVNTYIRDLESGLLLHTSADINSGGDKIMAQSTLLGVRQLQVPWTQGRLPRSVEGLRLLAYEGAQDTSIPGTPLFRSPMNVALKVTGRGKDFLQLERTGSLTIGTLKNDLGTTPLNVSPAQMTPFAVDPADLARLHQGQQLDVDPVTKIVTSVSFIGAGQDGKKVVIVTAMAPGEGQQRSDCLYDPASGLAVGLSQTNPALNQVTWLKLTGKQ